MNMLSGPMGALWGLPDEGQGRIRSRFRGCLLGGAAGDALGAPVEFMSAREIRETFGRQGIRNFIPAYGRLGAITDDTQMTLFTADGLLRAWMRWMTKGITTYEGVTAHAYLRWLKTQGEKSECGLIPGSEGWLCAHRELHHVRAPGATCLKALRDMKRLGDPAANNSKGCGGVMRVAPVGLFAWHSRHGEEAASRAFDLASDLAALTHGHPTGQLAAGAFAVLILGLVSGGTLHESLDATIRCLKGRPNHEETLQALEQARFLARSRLPASEAITELGEGWIAEEALAIAVYCALVAKSFEEGVAYAVNHSGDSDSTGSMAGNLLGALHGVDAIPERWLSPLELRDVIAEVADDLLDFSGWDIDGEGGGEGGESLLAKYPPN